MKKLELAPLVLLTLVMASMGIQQTISMPIYSAGHTGYVYCKAYMWGDMGDDNKTVGGQTQEDVPGPHDAIVNDTTWLQIGPSGVGVSRISAAGCRGYVQYRGSYGEMGAFPDGAAVITWSDGNQKAKAYVHLKAECDAAYSITIGRQTVYLDVAHSADAVATVSFTIDVGGDDIFEVHEEWSQMGWGSKEIPPRTYNFNVPADTPTHVYLICYVNTDHNAHAAARCDYVSPFRDC